MAIGVTDTKPEGNTASSPVAELKKHKGLVIGGAAIAGVLLLSHGSGSSASSTPQQQLQQPTTETPPPTLTGAFPTTDTGGGSYTSVGPAPTLDVTVNVPGTKKKHKKHPPPPKKKKPPKGAKGGGGMHIGKDSGPSKRLPHPKQAHKGKPHPADNKGKHPNSKTHTPHGARKQSPAVVESVQGAGSGIVVMGRQFPGALSHRLGSPTRKMDGTIARTVTVDYGGHTETHLVHNNGARWTDNVRGWNPPSRGVPIVNHGVPV